MFLHNKAASGIKFEKCDSKIKIVTMNGDMYKIDTASICILKTSNWIYNYNMFYILNGVLLLLYINKVCF